jgi:hypothetical protein
MSQEAKEEARVLSLEEIRAKVQARQQQGVDLSKLEKFEHAGLGGTVYYGPLSSYAMSRYENVEQYYPLDHQDVNLRGKRASTDELDQSNRERLLLRYGVWTADGKQLGDADVEWLLSDQASGPDNRRLALAVMRVTFASGEPRSEETGLITGFSRWEAAFHDLLVKSGWVGYWVEYVTSSDLSTPEAKEAALRLQKLEAAAPEWSKRMQAEEIVKSLEEVDLEPSPED